MACFSGGNAMSVVRLVLENVLSVSCFFRNRFRSTPTWSLKGEPKKLLSKRMVTNITLTAWKKDWVYLWYPLISAQTRCHILEDGFPCYQTVLTHQLLAVPIPKWTEAQCPGLSILFQPRHLHHNVAAEQRNGKKQIHLATICQSHDCRKAPSTLTQPRRFCCIESLGKMWSISQVEPRKLIFLGSFLQKTMVLLIQAHCANFWPFFRRSLRRETWSPSPRHPWALPPTSQPPAKTKPSRWHSNCNCLFWYEAMGAKFGVMWYYLQKLVR